ncbi:hypothetical protein diail_10509 [Diaporthe ilicicola]|nr:hypothetical protein diail_10509 [Diaporthe ilicicola]
MQAFSVLLTCAIAATGSAAALAVRKTTSVIQATGYSDFCESNSLDQVGGVLQVSGYCSSEPNGERHMGAALFVSHININECLGNNNGLLVPQAHGGALDSCHCDVGSGLCSSCNATSLKCDCETFGSEEKSTWVDMNQFLGVGLDDAGRVVLYCEGVYGEWNECSKNGAATES